MLVLSPTRELAEQTQKVALALGDFMNVQCHACIGGKSIGEDVRRLDYGVQARARENAGLRECARFALRSSLPSHGFPVSFLSLG